MKRPAFPSDLLSAPSRGHHVVHMYPEPEFPVRAVAEFVGDGLGLSIVRDLVQAPRRLHDGTVTAQSDGLGRGARFTVPLPLQTDLAPIL